MSGLLVIQSSDSLVNMSGFRNLERVETLVVASMSNMLRDLNGFNSLFEASIIIITRNTVRPYHTLTSEILTE